MKGEEDLVEYSALKSEIIEYESMRQNTALYMYTVYTAFLALAFQVNTPYVFIFSYVAIIPFQCHIISLNFMECRKAIYLIEFFENERNDIHWERLHTFKPMLDLYKEHNKTLWGMLSNYDSVILGIISTMAVIFSTVSGGGPISISICLPILFAIILLSICIFIAYKAKRYDKHRNEKLMDIMKKYKIYCKKLDKIH